MPTGARTHEEREGHLEIMEQALLDGRSVKEVVAAAVQKFGVSQSTAYQDVDLIRDRWREEGQKHQGAEFAKAVNRRERLIGRALKVASKAESSPGQEATVLSAISTAASLERDKSKLLGLYPEKKVSIRDERHRSVTDMTDEELLAIVASAAVVSDDELARIAGVKLELPAASVVG
ncbi:hypothetical protein J8F10_06625 [Gemmata sp. G18]|uniref:Uncharacterized protein n=1 Tax=Gemmata palustris TaxID=2822762 RepID=A0ABS5BML9_9BACT|nr:hypothetical protein [Gemmata palustris]MBP3954955.1 hypothetical protein [Gemmata palustris]